MIPADVKMRQDVLGFVDVDWIGDHELSLTLDAGSGALIVALHDHARDFPVTVSSHETIMGRETAPDTHGSDDMADHVEIKTIERVERTRYLSPNRNPAYDVYFTDGTKARTQQDAAWAYEASNASNIGVPLECHFTPRLKYLKYARRIDA